METSSPAASSKADVPTFSGAVELRGRFEEVRQFVQTIPPEKLDMRLFMETAPGECGCVLEHASRNGLPFGDCFDAQTYLGLSYADSMDLFALAGPKQNFYAEPTGQAAKDAFLRHLSKLEAKYCGEE